MSNSLKLGIIGCGEIGSALRIWIEEHNNECEVLISDPPKGFNDDLSECDCIFISIHIPTEGDGTQDLSTLKQIITKLPDAPVFIRTTLLPGTCEKIATESGKRVYFMPEFLTERTAYADFCSQPMVFTGEVELLKKIFVGKEFIEMSSTEAELSKYAHNVFGALKVTYFNGIYELAKKMNCNYKNIIEGALLSGYINKTHTTVPGPDGKRGYGGKCFPKDINALAHLSKDDLLGSLLSEVMSNNDKYRSV